jgi:hypothetical protein
MIITTANSRTRSVMVQDGLNQPVDFVELTDRVDKNLARLNLRLYTNYNPKDRDITRMFNPDVINIGTVWLNSYELTGLTGQVKQLYYYEQQAGSPRMKSIRERCRIRSIQAGIPYHGFTMVLSRIRLEISSITLG